MKNGHKFVFLSRALQLIQFLRVRLALQPDRGYVSIESSNKNMYTIKLQALFFIN